MKKSGFTLAELIIAAAVLVGALLGLLGAFFACFNLNETARNLTVAMNVAQEQLEEIRNYEFDQISADYAIDGTANFFDPAPLRGAGAAFISPFGGDTDLLQARIVVTWIQRGGRQIGEDDNLNGSLDAGEDDNGNGQLDSPAEIVTLITER